MAEMSGAPLTLLEERCRPNRLQSAAVVAQHPARVRAHSTFNNNNISSSIDPRGAIQKRSNTDRHRSISTTQADRLYRLAADQSSSNITVKDFFNIREARKVGDVVVLAITSFSPGVGQMGAEDVDHPMAFVRHEFEGSWKPEYEGASNPTGHWLDKSSVR